MLSCAKACKSFRSRQELSMSLFLNLLFEQIAIPTSIYLQKSASIQPRTSPSKFGRNYSILLNRVLSYHLLLIAAELAAELAADGQTRQVEAPAWWTEPRGWSRKSCRPRGISVRARQDLAQRIRLQRAKKTRGGLTNEAEISLP